MDRDAVRRDVPLGGVEVVDGAEMVVNALDALVWCFHVFECGVKVEVEKEKK